MVEKIIVPRNRVKFKELVDDALKSDADIFFLVGEDVLIPENAQENLLKQINAGMKCISGWVPVSHCFVDGCKLWKAHKLVADNTVLGLVAPERSVIPVDYVGFGCLMCTRDILKGFEISDKYLEIKLLNGVTECLGIEGMFCNYVYELGHTIYIDGDVVCDVKAVAPISDTFPMPIKKYRNEPVIVLASDDKYVVPLAVTLKSIIDTREGGIRIFVLDDGISTENKKKLRTICDIEFIRIDNEKIKNLDTQAIWHTSSCYSRLLLPHVIPSDIQRVIYLDCDIIVQCDISELWNFDLGDYAFGAVEQDIGIPYFNSGVMVIDIENWTREKISEKSIEYASKNKCNLADQDAINNAVHGKFLRISGEWNRSIYFRYATDSKIIHFMGFLKPWDYNSNIPHTDLFFKYLKKTVFKNWKPVKPEEKRIIINQDRLALAK